MSLQQILQKKGRAVFHNECKISESIHKEILYLLLKKEITIKVEKQRWGIHSLTVTKVKESK
jgi:hypothetical protein